MGDCMSYDLDRRYQPERRAFHTVRWLRERRHGFDRRAKVAGLERRSQARVSALPRRPA
jgi:hypothetical protein